MLSADYTTGGRLIWKGTGCGRKHQGDLGPTPLPGSLLAKGRVREERVSWVRGIIELEARLRQAYQTVVSENGTKGGG